MPTHGINVTKLFTRLTGPSSLCLLGLSAISVHAQGLSPSAPTKEYVYFNGRLVAIEERGPAAPAGAVAVTPATIGPAGPTISSVVKGFQAPVPPVPPATPKDTSSGAAQTPVIIPLAPNRAPN